MSYNPITGTYVGYSVRVCDTFSNEEYKIIFQTKSDAIEYAKSNSGTMQIAYVYENGDLIEKYGTF